MYEIGISALTSEVAIGVYLTIGGYLLRRVWLFLKKRIDLFLAVLGALYEIAEKEMRPNGGVDNKETASLKDIMYDMSLKLDRIAEGRCERDHEED